MPLASMTLVVVAVLAGACDQTFEPIIPSRTLHFSVFGYLDPSADTQWIRVMPIRPLKLTSPGSYGDTVTLEDVSTGRTIEMRDSLFKYAYYSDSTLGSQGAYVHNFWTTQKIDPGATYRFSVRGDSGSTADAVVEIPQDYQVEVWITQPPANRLSVRDSDYLRVTGLKHLPFVGQAVHFSDGCGSGVDSVSYKATLGDDGTYTIPIARAAAQARGNGYCGIPAIGERDLWMVGSDSIWPSGLQYSTAGLGQAELTSNVTGAVGFLGGVLTKSVPYETCTFQAGGSPAPQYCKLRYNQTSAALSGTVTETRCGDGPIDSVTVQLTEIDQDPPEIRSYLTGADGGFGIEALDPATRYALKVRAKPLPVFGGGELDIYDIHIDTLTFASGELRKYDVHLRRLTPCDQKP
jgi:hypothetical protein